MPRPTLFALLFLLFLPSCAGPRTPEAETQPVYYVDPDSLPPTLLPPPPAENSPAWLADIRAVVAAQKRLSAGEMAELRDEQHLRLSLMTDMVAGYPRPEALPAVDTLLHRVMADAGAVIEADKQYWHTRRPYLADHRVKLLVDPIDASPGYPSGHTAETLVLAEVLGLLYPDRLTVFRARAEAIALHRVEAGVHSPSDIEGGHLLAMQIVGALMNSPAFHHDLQAAQDEIVH